MMHRNFVVDPSKGLIAALVLATGAAHAAGATPDQADVRVTLVAGTYAIGPARFTDIADVESWLRARDSRVVAIDRCAPAGTPQLVAAVGRLDAYARDSIEVRTLPAGAPACAAAKPLPIDDFVGFLRASDYTVTDEAGRSAIP